MHLTTIINLSFNQFLLWLSLSIILCSIIAAASAIIRLESCHFCDHHIVRPTLLTLDDRAETGLFKEPWVDPVQQGLTEIVVPGCSGQAAVMVNRLALVFRLCLLLAIVFSYRTLRLPIYSTLMG